MADEEAWMGYVYGLRFFERVEFAGYLVGLNRVRWYSPRQNARCIKDAGHFRHNGREENEENTTEPSPHNDPCRCGINIYRPVPAKLEEMMLESKSSGMPVALTRGWGKVAVHHDGFRVQKALITAIYFPEVVPQMRDYPGYVEYLTVFTGSKTTFAELVEASNVEFKKMVKIPTNES